jgi:hypothetical protein
VTIRDDHKIPSPAITNGGEHATLPARARIDYRTPKIERLGDLRSTVLGGSFGAGDSLPPNTKPI